MSTTEKLDTHQKALTLNLDPSIFGSFAEIGAGQEVARWFLVVGAASGTVAKAISAYDKEVSDDLYGSGSRYVSRQRLDAMLDHEWTQLLNQLTKARGSQTRFFCLVDTVSARNYAGTNEAHGWIGLRFQREPQGQPNDILLHINLLDPTNLLQQEAIGILGVNLIYAAFYQSQTKEYLLEGVAKDVENRVEIDYVDLRGPAFESWDLRALLAHLVRADFAKAVCFPSSSAPVPPTEVLHKKALVLAPGYFAHTDPAHAENPYTNAGFGHAAVASRVRGNEAGAGRILLPHTRSPQFERCVSRDPRCTPAYRRALCTRGRRPVGPRT